MTHVLLSPVWASKLDSHCNKWRQQMRHYILHISLHVIYSPFFFLETLREADITTGVFTRGWSDSLAKRAFSKCCWNCFRFSSSVLKYSHWEKHLASKGRAAWREVLMSLPIYLLTHRYQLEWCQTAKAVLPINCEWSPESVRPQSLISEGGLGWIGLALITVML